MDKETHPVRNYLSYAVVLMAGACSPGDRGSLDTGAMPASFLGSGTQVAERNDSAGEEAGDAGSTGTLGSAWDNWWHRADQGAPGFSANVGGLPATGLDSGSHTERPGSMPGGFLGADGATSGGFLRDNLTGGQVGGPGDW